MTHAQEDIETEIDRAKTLAATGHRAEALRTWTEVIERFGTTPARSEPLIVLNAWFYELTTLEELGRIDAAIARADQAIRRYGHEDRLEARILVADALGMKSRFHAKQGDRRNQLQALEQLLADTSDADDPRLRSRSYEALRARTSALLELGDVDGARANSELLLARLDEEHAPEAQVEAGERALDVGGMFYRRDLVAEGLAIFEALSKRLEPATAPALQPLMARTQLNIGICLTRLGRVAEARASYESLFGLGEDALLAFDEVLQHTERDGDAGVEVAFALMGRAISLGGLNRSDEALRTLDDLIKRFRANPSEPIRRIVRAAEQARAEVSG